MQIRRFEYSQHVGKPEEWRLLPFSLQDVTLLVGKNAAGKSRTLAVINSLAKWLRGNVQLEEGTWDVDFEESGHLYRYQLQLVDGIVRSEQFTMDMQVKLERSADGSGIIDSEQTTTGKLRFQIPMNTLAVVQKRDLSQARFLEPLHQWAESVRCYPFGDAMGRTKVAVFHETGKKPDPTDADQVVGLFHDGSKRFPGEFERGVIDCMARIGYDLESVKVAPLSNITATVPFPVTFSGIAVKERDLQAETNQLEMSSGMFRALSIAVHLQYAEMASRPGTIIIDDIGEGLDYERSKALIQLVCERAAKNDVQLIMSTNDRFVMNTVPLEFWAVLTRKGGTCRIHNQASDPAGFEQFKLTGLSNFDLFRGSGNIFETAPAQ